MPPNQYYKGPWHNLDGVGNHQDNEIIGVHKMIVEAGPRSGELETLILSTEAVYTFGMIISVLVAVRENVHFR